MHIVIIESNQTQRIFTSAINKVTWAMHNKLIPVLLLESRVYGKYYIGPHPTLTQHVPYAAQFVRWYHSSQTCAKSKSRISMWSNSLAELIQQAVSPCTTRRNAGSKSEHFTAFVFEWFGLSLLPKSVRNLRASSALRPMMSPTVDRRSESTVGAPAAWYNRMR